MTRVYGIAAALLVPWIVALAIIEPRTGIARRVRGLTIAAMVVLAVLLLTTAWALRRRRLVATMTATSACTLALIAGWFHVVTLRLGNGRTRSVLAVVLVLIVAGVGAWAVTALRRGGAGPMLRGALVTAAALCLLAAGPVWFVAPAVASVDHLKAAWVGLDLAELTGLIATTIAVGRRRPWLVLAGAMTGTLLLFDAVVNVVTTTGAVQISAMVMWLAEVPLGVGALLLAWSTPER